MKLHIPYFVGFAAALLGVSAFAMSPAGVNPAAESTMQTSNDTIQLSSADAELVHAIDTRSAMQGQLVTAKLTDSIKTPQGVKLPSGTDLVGKVDRVQTSNDDGPAKLVLTFNKAQLKDGTKYPVKATLVDVEPPDSPGLLRIAVGPQSKFEQEPGMDGGMSMQSAVQQQVSGTLTDPHHNFKLQSGSQLLVAVGVQQSKAGVAGAS